MSFDCAFRNSVGCSLVGHTLWMYGGTRSGEDDNTVYHSDMYMLDCESLRVPFMVIALVAVPSRYKC